MEPTSTGGEPRAPQHNFEQAAPFVVDPRFDFRRTVPLRKSYIVASSYRCGSTFFCSKLWGTGILGAPGEYLNVEAAMSWYPSILRVLSPVTYIYLNRKDALAQAVSMAKAMQTDAWQHWDEEVSATLIYNGPLIAHCLRELHQQKLGWLRWFEVNRITPFIVHYEESGLPMPRVWSAVSSSYSMSRTMNLNR